MTALKYSISLPGPGIGKCDLCDRTANRVNDHCHIHGWVRGYLCRGCNIRLGRVELDSFSMTMRTPEILDLMNPYRKRCHECIPLMPIYERLTDNPPPKDQIIRLPRCVSQDYDAIRVRIRDDNKSINPPKHPDFIWAMTRVVANHYDELFAILKEE